MTRTEPWTVHGNSWNHNLSHSFGNKGFGRRFANNNESPLESVVRQFSLHRLAVVPEPQADVVFEDDVQVSDTPAKRLKTATYMDVVSKSSPQSWKEQRDSMWEVAIRRWHSCAMTWTCEDNIVHMLQSKHYFRGRCQIIVDILHHKAPGTLLHFKVGQRFTCS